jgi:hypothetical protein
MFHPPFFVAKSEKGVFRDRTMLPARTPRTNHLYWSLVHASRCALAAGRVVASDFGLFLSLQLCSTAPPLVEPLQGWTAPTQSASDGLCQFTCVVSWISSDTVLKMSQAANGLFLPTQAEFQA